MAFERSFGGDEEPEDLGHDFDHEPVGTQHDESAEEEGEPELIVEERPSTFTPPAPPRGSSKPTKKSKAKPRKKKPARKKKAKKRAKKSPKKKARKQSKKRR